MPDIELRFNKDMLVMSTSLNHAFASHDFSIQEDRTYVVLCEPELLDEQYALEEVIGTPCVVAPTEDITQARLAHARFDGAAAALAENAFEQAAQHSPQHIIAAVGPAGLPLDESSAASLKQMRDQYKDAVRALSQFAYDAIWFCGFDDSYEMQCALMGARAVYDGPLMASFAVDENGKLAESCDATLSQAAAMAQEYGANVVGISTSAGIAEAVSMVKTLKEACDVPLLVELLVSERLRNVLNPPANNPYYDSATMVDAALALQRAGVQFLRAGGNATCAYTGALLSAVDSLDVVL